MRTLIIQLIFVFSAILVNAQPPREGRMGPEHRAEMREEIKAQKVAFITTQLNLTTEEAQKFWPVYNEFESKIEAIIKQQRALRREFKQAEEGTISDGQIDEAIKKMFDLEQQELALKRAYHEKYKQVLSLDKIARLYKAEHEFKQLLLKRLSDRRENR